MLFVKFQGSLPVEVSSTPQHGEGWQSRWDWKSFEQVEGIAKYLTAMTGKTYLGSDAGPSTSPRFDIMEAPKVGDEVSYSFNGDTYPDGTIVKISPKWMVTTSTGKRYNRSRSGVGDSWRSVGGGTWSLIPGHHSELNPSF